MNKSVFLIIILMSGSLFLFCEDFAVLGPFSNLRMYESETIDAKSEALGRCSILSTCGANYVFNNAAMLSTISQKDIQFSGRLKFGEDKLISNDGNNASEYPINFRVNGFSFGIPIIIPNSNNLKFGLGLGYRTYFDLSKEIDQGDNSKIKYSGGFSNVVIGGGINYHEKILFGFSTSFPFLSNFSREVININNDKIQGPMTGTFFTVSSTYIYSEKLILGARLKTAFKLKWEDKSEEEKYEFSVPFELGLALSFKPNSSLTVFAEYLTRNFSYYTKESGPNFNQPYKDLNNGYSIRTGFELKRKVTYRGGLFLQSLPIYEILDDMDDEAEYNKEPKSELGLTTGLGINIYPNLSLNIYGNYSFLKFDQNYDSSYLGQISKEYSESNVKAGCSLGFSF